MCIRTTRPVIVLSIPVAFPGNLFSYLEYWEGRNSHFKYRGGGRMSPLSPMVATLVPSTTIRLLISLPLPKAHIYFVFNCIVVKPQCS